MHQQATFRFPRPDAGLLTARAGAVLLVACAMLPAAALAQPGQAQVQFQPFIVPGADKVEPEKVAERIEDPVKLKQAFDQIVTDLGSDDFNVRLKASERLGDNDQFDLPMLEAALKRPDLTLEARSRLMNAARSRFFRSPRAALGFQFGGVLRDRIVVGTTFRKFPSFGMLEEGGMIVGADGQKLEGPGARFLLQSVIVSHDPGETLHLSIRRADKKLELDIPLGKFADLDQGGGAAIMEDRLSKAWRIRAQAKLGAVVEPVRADNMPKSWGPTEDIAQRRMNAMMQRDANDPAVKIVGGGMPRGAKVVDDSHGFDQIMRQQVMWINGQVRMVNMPVFRNGFMGDMDPDSGLPPVAPEEELRQLLEARMEMQKRTGPGADTPEGKKNLDIIIKQEKAIQAEVSENRAAAGTSGKTSAADANDRATP